MEKFKKSNKIFLWGTILAITSLLLCYVFVVLYFFYISPNNISIKFSLWPFLDDKTIAQMYLDATVDIEVSGEESFVGVNVKENGVIVAP